MFRHKYDILVALDRVESLVHQEPFRWSQVSEVVVPQQLTSMAGSGLVRPTGNTFNSCRTKEWVLTEEARRLLISFRYGSKAVKKRK